MEADPNCGHGLNILVKSSFQYLYWANFYFHWEMVAEDENRQIKLKARKPLRFYGTGVRAAVHQLSLNTSGKGKGRLRRFAFAQLSLCLAIYFLCSVLLWWCRLLKRGNFLYTQASRSMIGHVTWLAGGFSVLTPGGQAEQAFKNSSISCLTVFEFA